MSGFEGDGPSVHDDLTGAGFEDGEPMADEVWSDDGMTGPDEPPVDHLDLDLPDEPPSVPDLPPPDPAGADGPEVGGMAPPDPPPPPEPPVLYEEGSLVSQVPVAEDLVTVEAITDTSVYREWKAGQAAGAAIAGDVIGGGDLGVSAAGPGMVGEPDDSSFWFQQNTKYTCGPAAATQIVNDFLGTGYVDESTFAAFATAAGKLDPEIGMFPEDLEWLLDAQDVPSETHYGQHFGDVERYLREGRAVVMFVDARDVVPAGYEAFAAEDEPENSAADAVDHFVRVIGIDQAAGIAIVSNPGVAGGAQMEIPLASLTEAWNDVTGARGLQPVRDHILIVSEVSDPTPDGPAETEAQSPRAEPVVLPTPQPVPGADPPPGPLDPRPVDPGPLELPVDPGPLELPADASDPPPLDPTPEPGRGREPDGADMNGPDRRPPQVVLSDPDGGLAPASGIPRPAEVVLPADPSALPAAEVPVTPAVASDGGLFSAVPGWVLIPVTMAAGRVGAAVLERRRSAGQP